MVYHHVLRLGNHCRHEILTGWQTCVHFGIVSVREAVGRLQVKRFLLPVALPGGFNAVFDKQNAQTQQAKQEKSYWNAGKTHTQKKHKVPSFDQTRRTPESRRTMAGNSLSFGE
jgi:hypothetical protein